MLSFYGCIPDIKLEIKNILRFLEKSSICLRKFCLDVLGIIVVVVTLKIVCWEAIFRYFWANFWNVPQFLENFLIFSHEILQKCSWYCYESHHTKRLFHGMFSSTGSQCGVFFGLFWCILFCLLKSVQYFYEKFCTDILNITLTVAEWKKIYYIISSLWRFFCNLWAVFWVHLGPF